MWSRTAAGVAALMLGCLLLLSADCNDTLVLPPANQPPQNVTFVASPTSGTSPLTVVFSGSAIDPDGRISSYRLDFGDGAFSDDPNSTHTYNSAGSMVFTARLSVRDDDFAQSVATQEITVGGAPCCIPPASPTVSFAANVAPLFSACTACHGSGATPPQLTGTAADYAAVRARSDECNPPASTILLKPTNTAPTTHGGGMVWTVGGSQYNTVLTWIGECRQDN